MTYFMASKIEKAMDVLKFIPEPTTIQIQAIANDIGCSERQVWRALKRLRKIIEIEETDVIRVSELTSLLKSYYELIGDKYRPIEKATPKWLELVKKVEGVIYDATE